MKMGYYCIPLMIAFLAVATYSQGDKPGFIPIKYNTAAMKITIDGKDTEWGANRTTVINKNTAFGFYKDEGFLYVHVITTDPEFSMQIMNFGLIIWIDPTGSQKKEVGVQFPVIQLQPPPPREGGKPPRGEELEEFLDKRLKDIVIEFPENQEMKQMTRVEADKHGIDAMIGVDEQKSAICYELKYPLRGSAADDTMAVDLSNKKYLDICIETPEVNPAKLNERDADSQETSERDIRPPKTTEDPKPPKPTIKPSGAGISQWVRVLF